MFLANERRTEETEIQPLWDGSGVSIVRILKNIDCVIMALQCICILEKKWLQYNINSALYLSKFSYHLSNPISPCPYSVTPRLIPHGIFVSWDPFYSDRLTEIRAWISNYIRLNSGMLLLLVITHTYPNYIPYNQWICVITSIVYMGDIHRH